MRDGAKALPVGGVEQLLDALEAPAPSPCGGTAAALSAAMAAALVTMVARASKQWDEAPGVAERARELRQRLVVLGREDVDAFARVLDVLRETGATPAERDAALAPALLCAAEAPLRIAEAAAEVAGLAALVAEHGSRPLRADAATAASLAGAAVRAAAHLVEVNLAVLPGGERSEQAATLAAGAAAVRSRAPSDSPS